MAKGALQGSHLLWLRRSVPGDLRALAIKHCPIMECTLQGYLNPTTNASPGWLSMFHSQLLDASLLSSFPAPIDMLKFGA